MQRTDLLNKLRVVGQALAETNLIPIYQCFCFNGQTVSAYNDTIGVVTECQTNQPFAVNGKVLLGLLENSNADDVTFELKGHDVILTLGANTSTLPCFPKADFLFVEPDIGGPTMSIKKDFIEGLQACLLTSSKDLAHPAFMGVYINHQFKDVTLYSTDGDAISSYILLGHQAHSGMDAMLPNAFVTTLVSVAEWHPTFKTQDGTLKSNEEWVVAELENGYAVYGRLIQLDNPVDHNAEIKKTINGKAKFIKVPEGLDQALSRARVVADAESKPTSIAAGDEGIQLLTESAYGVIDDFLPIKHPTVGAKVSAELMQRCLKLCDEMTIQDNCCAFRNGKKLFILTSNMGD